MIVLLSSWPVWIKNLAKSARRLILRNGSSEYLVVGFAFAFTLTYMYERLDSGLIPSLLF